MINRKSYKLQVTELVLKEIPKELNVYLDIPIENILFKWWLTGRQEGLRLTDEGHKAFTLAKIEGFDVPLYKDDKIPIQRDFILELSKKIKCPYFLGVNKNSQANAIMPYVRLYDSKIVMMINLYGNLRTYLNSLRIR